MAKKFKWREILPCVFKPHELFCPHSQGTNGSAAMSKQAVTNIPVANWSDVHFKTPREAILNVDLAVEKYPDDARHILGTAWTALAILSKGRGIPAPKWLSTMALFCKLTPAERDRVREAVEMRMNALDRKAA